MLPIILASSSPYRRKLLNRLGLEFTSVNPNTDETPLPGEPAKELVKRLALAKAQVVSQDYLNHLIIGSDQVGTLNNNVLCKPGNHDAAVTQLQRCSGKTVTFYTGLCLLNSKTHATQCVVEPFTVTFRKLSDQQLERYLLKEKPYDCAGSFKLEELGITLFESMSGSDPNSLEGLPLIQLVTLLNNEGYTIP